MISIGFKGTYAGGKLYGPVDQIQSAYLQELVYLNSGFNSLRFRDYFRIDTKINWRMNADKVTHEIGLDLVNITNQRNLLSLSYAPDLFNPSAEPTAERLQLGFLPIFYYRADFRIAKGKNKEN